jgi:hypothetical protein
MIAGMMPLSIALTVSPMCITSMRTWSSASDGVLNSSSCRNLVRTMIASSSSGLSGTSHSTRRAIWVVNQMKISVLAMLKKVWALAIWRGVSAARRAVPVRSG